VAGSFYEVIASKLPGPDRNLFAAWLRRCILQLFGKQFLQFLDAMAAREIDEAFAGIAFGQIDFKYVLE
jgi:hypothetical protein